MNDNQNNRSDKVEGETKRSKASSYVKWIVLYAVAILLIILAINFDAFETAVARIFSVITPVFYGAIIAYLCNPIYVFFHKKLFKNIKSVKWKKTLSILLTYLIVFLIILSLLFLVADQMIESVNKFITNLDQYIADAEEFIIGIIDKIGNSIPSLPTEPKANIPTDTLPVTPEDPSVTTDIIDSIESSKVSIFDFSFTKEGVIEFIHSFLSSSGDIINNIGNAIISSGTATIFFVINLSLGFVFSVYMLAEKDLIIAKFKKLAYAFLDKDRADAICEFGNYADEKVGHFIKGKLIESAIVGIMAYLAFLIFRIPGPLMIAVIVAIMNIIPIFGPFLGAVPAALIVLIMEPAKTIPYIIIVVLIMQINGNYISPKIVGRRTGLTPLGAIVALTLMSGYFGVVGMFIGIPICAIVVETLWRKSNKRLEEKNLATDLAAYYPPDALVEQDDGKPHNITALVVNATVSIFCKIFRINRKRKKDKNNIDGTSNDTGDKQ